MTTSSHQLIARAILIRDNCVLVNSSRDPLGRPYCALPGGHVDPGEDCKFALQREIVEEMEGTISVGDLAFVSEQKYLGGKNGDQPRHEVVLFFHAALESDLKATEHGVYSPESQKNFLWLPLTQMDERNLIPSALRPLLRKESAPLYDFNDAR